MLLTIMTVESIYNHGNEMIAILSTHYKICKIYGELWWFMKFKAAAFINNVYNTKVPIKQSTTKIYFELGLSDLLALY